MPGSVLRVRGPWCQVTQGCKNDINASDWPASMSRPVTYVQPWRIACRMSGVGVSEITTSPTSIPGSSDPMSAGMPSSACIPTVDALTIMSTSAAIRQRSPRGTPGTRCAASAASAAARPCLRIHDRQRLQHPGRELAADRAARASGAEQATLAGLAAQPHALRGAHESRAVEHVAAPRPIRLAAKRIRRRRCTAAVCPSRVAKGTARALYGTVTSNPSRFPSAISAGTVSSNLSAGTCTGTSTAFMPAVAKRSV